MKYIRAVLTWMQTSIFTRPFRALIIAYTYVLTGTKVETPYEWKDI